ncbi:TPA: PIN domain-containing protein [archaeon]|nr:PIN domain-containing protein [Candidatus Naiadarchaeales archaeon SRR2090153.bin461]HIK02963.1 PIN domain-containing protein [Candidatus Naiadarchaeales archaeon SRR2090159.bin1288]
MYAETDFLLSLFKKEDWLKKKAENIYNKHKDELWTSTITVLEMLLWARREGYDPNEVIDAINSLVEVRETLLDKQTLLIAANFMKEYKMTPFDSMHAVLCGEDTIISSDQKYDLIGLKRIKLEE